MAARGMSLKITIVHQYLHSLAVDASFSQQLAGMQPNVLTRGVWAGGARHGVVLWSSDIESTFEELTVQVPQGV